MKRRALFFVGPGHCDVREEEMGRPAPGEVLVRTVASAISAGTELLLYRDLVPEGLAVDETIPALSGRFSFPQKYGYALVGEVALLGRDVDPVWKGRLVFAFHPHESHFCAAPAELVPLPGGVATDDALFLANMETAVALLMDGQPAIGEQVAVFGQGVVGLLTAALLARFPVSSLVTLDRHPARREASLAIGAHASLDPAVPGGMGRVEAQLQRGRPYAGADLCFELSGASDALAMAIAVTGPCGRVIIGSWYGSKRVDLDLGGQFHRRRIRLIGSQVSHVAPELAGRWTKERRLMLAWRMLAEVRPSRLITHRFAFDKAREAYAILDQRPEQAIQVVLAY